LWLWRSATSSPPAQRQRQRRVPPVGRGRHVTLVALNSDDLQRSAELVERYADLPLGAADASIIAVVERLRIRQILTLDRAHFSIVRPRHVDVLALLP
jgi:predicted nucleic acid-binding protein